MNMQHAYSCLLLACALLHAATAYPFFHEPNALHRCPAAPSTAPPVATASSTDGPATRVNMHHPVIIAFAAVFAVCVALIAAFAVRRRLASCDTSKSVSHDGEQDAIQYGYVDDVFGTVAWFAMCTATLLLQLSLGALCLDFYLDLRIFGSDVFSAFIVMWHVSCIWLVVVFAAGDWLADAFRIPTALEFATTVRVVTPRASPGGTLDRLARLYLRRFGAGALDDVGVRKVRHGVPTAEPPGKPRDLVHDLVQRFVDWNAHDAIDVAVEDGSITVRCLRMPFDRHLGRFRSAPAESNALEFPSLTVSQAVRAELFGLFYVYQLHMLWVWAIFSYWRMSACSLVLVVTALVFKVRAAVSADRKVRELASAHSMATCVVVTPDGDVPVPVARLRPGDRVRIASESTVPADLVLLQGEVVVDESMLTGESRPVRKFPAANAQDKGRQHQLWSGTSVIQSAATSEAIVAATGASTLKGQLLREILFPAAVEFVFDNELAIVILILCTWGIVGGLCTVALLNGTDGTWFYSMCSITCVLSPMLPAMLVVGQAVASRRLASKRVNCTQMTRIALAGKVSVACFDKTGTLTRSGLEFSSVHAIERRSFHARPSDAVDDLPGLLRLALGTAHSLSALEDGRLVGNAVDLEMFKKSGCAMDGSVVRCGDQRVEIVRVLPFEHGRQRMSVVVRDLSSGALSLFCKGSPEQVASLADPALLPADFDSVVKRHAREGHYTLAVAHRPVSSDDLSGSREHLERHLSVLGVVMFVNPLKPCTADAIAELAPSTRCVMVTGDTALTGICIARRCGMIPTGRRVLLGACRGPPPGSAVFWVDAANGHPVDDDDVNDADVELAVTSRAFHALVEQGRLGDLLPRVRVFGRMRPDDKVACIRAHQNAGAIVAMVGDGANDSAALRAAHVGLALSESDASFVAPFSTDSGTIGAFVDLVRHGRAALATNLAAYRFLVLYGEVLIVAKLLSAYFSVVMDEAVWMALDVAVSIGLSAALTTARPSPGPLSSRRPTARLLGPETLSATIGTIAINVAFFAVVVAWMFHQSSWYLCHEWDGRALDNMMAWWLLADNYEAGIIGIVTFAQVAIVAAVANLGGPFRAAWIRNRVFVVVLGAYVALWSAVVLGGTNALSCLFHVNCSRASNEMPVRARLDLFAIVVANAVAVWAYHYVVVFGPGRRWFQRQGNAASDTVSKSVAVNL